MVGLVPVLLVGFAGRLLAQPDYHKNAEVLRYVNPHIGTYGVDPNDNGGMIPSVCPPFGMTRWAPQSRENFISQVPYNYGDQLMHGFQATHQPGIRMCEAGQVATTPGMARYSRSFRIVASHSARRTN